MCRNRNVPEVTYMLVEAYSFPATLEEAAGKRLSEVLGALCNRRSLVPCKLEGFPPKMAVPNNNATPVISHVKQQ